MISYFRNVLAELRLICAALGELVDAVHALNTRGADTTALDARLAALELEIDKRDARAEALLLKAEGKFKAARASEERARRLAEGVEQSEEEELEEIRQAYADAGIPLGNGGGSGEEEVPSVPTRLGRRLESKSAAFAMKFGR